MKKTCKYCGIVDVSHNCPYKSKRIYKKRTDNQMYKTSKWQTLRLVILNKYNYVCLYSFYVERKIIQANIVHHIIEVSEDESKMYDEDNLIPLSYKAHQEIHDRYRISLKEKLKTIDLLRQIKMKWENRDYNF